jgi:hypothetical protein
MALASPTVQPAQQISNEGITHTIAAEHTINRAARLPRLDILVCSFGAGEKHAETGVCELGLSIMPHFAPKTHTATRPVMMTEVI